MARPQAGWSGFCSSVEERSFSLLQSVQHACGAHRACRSISAALFLNRSGRGVKLTTDINLIRTFKVSGAISSLHLRISILPTGTTLFLNFTLTLRYGSKCPILDVCDDYDFNIKALVHDSVRESGCLLQRHGAFSGGG